MLARAFGFDLKEKPTPKEMQSLFDEAMETPMGSISPIRISDGCIFGSFSPYLATMGWA